MTFEHSESSNHYRGCLEILLKTDRLAELIPCTSSPIAREAIYTVDAANPLIPPVDLPPELVAGGRQHITTTLEFSTYETDGAQTSERVVAFDFDDDSHCRLKLPDEPVSEVGYHFIPPETFSSITSHAVFDGTIATETVSEAVSRCVAPKQDPTTTDYGQLKTAERRQEVHDLLAYIKEERINFVDMVETEVYVIDNHTIIISRQDGQICEVTVSLPPVAEAEQTVTMRTTFEAAKYSQELFWSGGSCREPIPLTEHRIEAFEETLDRLLGLLEPQVVLVEDLTAQETNAVYTEERDTADIDEPASDPDISFPTPTVPGPEASAEGLS